MKSTKTNSHKREVSPVEEIINEVMEKLKSQINEFLHGEQTDVNSAEIYLGRRIAEAVVELMQAYYEKRDRELLEDRAGRRRAGLRVERRGDKREILTRLGKLEYTRTYYKKASGGYEYPVDSILFDLQDEPDERNKVFLLHMRID